MNKGAFEMMRDAIASGDPRRIRAAQGEALTAIECICSMANVLADYAHLRAQHPKDCLYASDYDIAQTACTLSDLASCACSALVAANRAHDEKTIKED